MTPAEIKFLRWARQRMDWGFEVAGACRYYTDRAQGIEIATKFFTSGYVDEEARITPLGRDALLLQEFMIDNGVKPNS
jgi:hypothetical protein